MIKPLTSLRFLFALMVFASHMSFLLKSGSEWALWLFTSILKEGYIGVSFFFILSGFILAYNYQDRFLSRRISKSEFYRARFARIFPLHILTLILAVPLSWKHFMGDKALWVFQLVTNATLTQSYIPIRSIYFSFNGPSWSISNEMFFYLAFPFITALIPKLRNHRNSVLIFILSVLPLLFTITPEEYFHAFFYVNPFTRVLDFVIGIVIFNAFRIAGRKEFKVRHDLLEVTSVILFVVFFAYHQWVPKVARYSYYYWIPMSFLIFAFAFQKGRLSHFLSKKAFIHLGEISFGFYMFHSVVFKYYFLVSKKYDLITHDIFITAIVLSLTLVISHFSYQYFETPMNRLIRKSLDKREQSPLAH